MSMVTGADRDAGEVAFVARSIADDAFYEWMLSDHPLAAAERERRREQHYLLRHEQRALIRQLVDHWTPEASERLFALRESMGRFADRWERVCDEWQQGERVDVDTVRARFTLEQRDRGRGDYRYPERYLGPQAASSPPPPSPDPSPAHAAEEPQAGAVVARLAQTSGGEFLFERFAVEAGAVEARPEVAPAQAVTVVERAQGRTLTAVLRWGLPPATPHVGWARGRVTEAPAETALDAPLLAGPVRRRRVLVPVDRVDGWGGHAGPTLSLRRHDRDVLCLAGVCDRRPDPVTGEEVAGVALLTVEADARMRRRGARMPLVLDSDEEGDWLDAALGVERLAAILVRPRSSVELSVAATRSRVHAGTAADA
jgi:putative SOS response-associated peptidase YedK